MLRKRAGNEGKPVTDLSDGVLLDRYRRGGDAGSLEVLVDRYRRRLFGFILNMTEGRDDADEIFQEVWLKVIKKIDRYEHRKSFCGWLVRIARNVVIDRWRRRSKLVSLEQVADSGVAGELLVDSQPDPARNAGSKEIGEQIAAAIACLPQKQKEVVIMRVRANLSFKEIAEAQGVSINTALARMQYGLTKLRHLLKNVARDEM